MGSKIYVGGLAYSVTEGRLQELFSTHGTVASANVISDKFTGQSRGFGFVEMSNDDEARSAINQLNGSTLEGRSIIVNEANERPERGRGGGFSRDRRPGGDRGGYRDRRY